MDEVHKHISGTVAFIDAAFPSGVRADDYKSLLWILDEADFSIRAIASVIASAGISDWAHAYNDTLGVLAEKAKWSIPAAELKRSIDPALWARWLKEIE